MKITCTGRKVNLKDALYSAWKQSLQSWTNSFPTARSGERYRDRGKGLADGGGDR
jgi:hypothetical protein